MGNVFGSAYGEAFSMWKCQCWSKPEQASY